MTGTKKSANFEEKWYSPPSYDCLESFAKVADKKCTLKSEKPKKFIFKVCASLFLPTHTLRTTDPFVKTLVSEDFKYFSASRQLFLHPVKQ